MIYFIAAKGTNKVKIGYTSGDPTNRLKSLQTGSSEPLEIIAAIPGTMADEKSLHAQFDHLRIPGGGQEWFRRDPALEASICALRVAIGSQADTPDREVKRSGDMVVKECTATVRKVTVGRSNLTQTMVRQLPQKCPINLARFSDGVRTACEQNWDKIEFYDYIEGNIWGWCEWGNDLADCATTLKQIIFSHNARLYAFLYNPRLGFGLWDVMLAREQDKIHPDWLWTQMQNLCETFDRLFPTHLESEEWGQIIL